MSGTLDTRVHGDPRACRAAGEWMGRVAGGSYDAASLLAQVRDRTGECWRGDAANAFQDHIGRGGREADRLSAEIDRAGRALVVFADDLDTVRARLRQAREVAADAGLTVTPDGIEPPPTVMLPAEPTTPQQIAATQAQQRRELAWNEVHQTVAEARGMELAAHERLATATNTPSGVIEGLRSGSPFLAAGGALAAAGGLHQQSSRFRDLSRLHARESLEITRRLAATPGLNATERTRLQAGRNTLLERSVKEHRIAQGQARYLGGLGRTTVGQRALDLITRAPADDIHGDRLFARGGRVLGKIPYSGMAVTSWQTYSDVRDGKPVDQAVGSAVISTGVGTVVTSGMLALAPVAIAGGPFTLAAVGVGAAAAWGVGYLVDTHWDDIKDTAGDAADAIGSGAATAARAVRGWVGG